MTIQEEALLTFNEAAAYLPLRPNLSTLHRWRLKGVRGVRLQTCLVGGRRYTSKEALERFSVASTAAADGETAPARTPRQQDAAVRAADIALDKAGI